MVLALALLFLTGPARADDPPGGEDLEPEAAPLPEGVEQRDESFEIALEQAKELYFAGRHEEALERLQGLRARLESGEVVDPELAGDALIYLGEILQVTGRNLESYETFKYAVSLNPKQTISIYHHLPEVVKMFGQARLEVLQERPDPDDPDPPVVVEPPPLPRAPWWTWAPLGLPQLGQGRVGRGLIYAGLQLGLGAGSLALYASLRRDIYDDGIVVGVNADTYPGIQSRRALQWAATFAFYGSWAASTADAHAWHRTHAVAVTPTEAGGASLRLQVGF